jgi:hypothetical protein
VIQQASGQLVISSFVSGSAADRFVEWRYLWPRALIAGMPCGALVWLFWGWWFRLRLRFCGAPDVSRRRARNVWLYSSAVYLVPSVFWAVVETVLYHDYLEASNAAPLGVSFGLLSGWSCFVAYRGVIGNFPVRHSAALWWFLILPLGGLGLLFAGVVAVSLGNLLTG